MLLYVSQLIMLVPNHIDLAGLDAAQVLVRDKSKPPTNLPWLILILLQDEFGRARG